MLPEQEIQLEKNRVNSEIKAAIIKQLEALKWSSCDWAKAAGKRASTLSEFNAKQGNYETDTLLDNSYYIGCKVFVKIEPYSFKGYTPEKKLPKKKK